MLAKFAFASCPLAPLPCHCLFIFTIFRQLKQLTIKQHFSNWMKRFASSASDMLRWKCAPSELKPVLNGLLHSPSPTSSLVPVSGPARYKHKRGALPASELEVWKLPRIEWNWHYKFWVIEKVYKRARGGVTTIRTCTCILRNIRIFRSDPSQIRYGHLLFL